MGGAAANKAGLTVDWKNVLSGDRYPVSFRSTRLGKDFELI